MKFYACAEACVYISYWMELALLDENMSFAHIY